MLIITESVKTPSVNLLTKIWAERYTPDLSKDSLQDPWSDRELVEHSIQAGRAITCAKLKPPLIDIKCQMAGILARDFYEYIPNVVDLNEARQLTQSSKQVYIKLLEVYQLSSAIATSQRSMLLAMAGVCSLKSVAHSCLRDLNMFQAYLFLCLLEESMEPVSNELVPLCVMVMESVAVKWELTAQWT